MPRPQKATADYFQHHVKRGKTMFTLESKYGNDGYALWFKTLELLTSTEHHYLNFSDESLWEYYLTFVNLDESKTMEILTLLSKLNAIDADLWKVKIVWCENLISNLSGLYNKRTVKPLDKSQIIVVSGADIPNNDSFSRIKPHSIEENTIEKNTIEEGNKKYPLINSLLPVISKLTKQPIFNNDIFCNSLEITLQKVKALTGENFISEMEQQWNWGTNPVTIKNSVNPVKDLNVYADNKLKSLQKKESALSYNTQPKVSLRPKMSDESTEYYHSYCKKRYEDEGLEWKGEVYNGQ